MNKKVKMLALLVLVMLALSLTSVPKADALPGPLDRTSLLDTRTTYRVDIPNLFTGYFTEVSGMGTTNDVIEHRVVDSTGKDTTQLIPGRLKFNSITLKRGLTSDMALWDWRQLVANGKITEARRNGSIYMYSETSKLVAQWDIVKAWPSQITTTIEENGILSETAIIVCEGIVRVK